MGLPAQLDSNLINDSTFAVDIDDKVMELLNAVADILGLTRDVNVNKALLDFIDDNNYFQGLRLRGDPLSGDDDEPVVGIRILNIDDDTEWRICVREAQSGDTYGDLLLQHRDGGTEDEPTSWYNVAAFKAPTDPTAAQDGHALTLVGNLAATGEIEIGGKAVTTAADPDATTRSNGNGAFATKAYVDAEVATAVGGDYLEAANMLRTTILTTGLSPVMPHDGYALVEAWGGGGGGNGAQFGDAGGGQGGSYVCAMVSLSEGERLEITIGVGGSGGVNGTSSDGGDTIVTIYTDSDPWPYFLLTATGGKEGGVTPNISTGAGSVTGTRKVSATEGAVAGQPGRALISFVDADEHEYMGGSGAWGGGAGAMGLPATYYAQVPGGGGYGLRVNPATTGSDGAAGAVLVTYVIGT